MKILYLCSDLGIPVLGNKGAAVHVRALVSALSRAGHTTILTAPILNKSPWEQPSKLDGLLCHIPPTDGTKDAALTIKTFTESLGGASNSLAGEVRRILYNQELGQRLIRRFDSHPPDFIYERVSLYGTAGVELAQSLRRPLVVELNAPISLEQSVYRGTAMGELAARAERATLANADAIVVVSAAIRDYVTSLGIAAEKVHVMANGVDPALFCSLPSCDSTRRRFGIGDGPVVGFVGGLRPWHGIESLPELLGQLAEGCPTTQLVVVGEGPLRSTLQAGLRARGLLQQSVVTGSVPHDEVPSLIRTFDIAVAPYPTFDHTFYFSPLKLFEYMACGIPVVVPRIGQIEEIIRHGETGWLYPPGDMSALSSACKQLICDPPLRRRIGDEGARLVQERYTWDHNARRVVELVGRFPNHLASSL